jgi:hypothetical protein
MLSSVLLKNPNLMATVEIATPNLNLLLATLTIRRHRHTPHSARVPLELPHQRSVSK